MITHLVAMNPVQLSEAQSRLTDWMESRIARVDAELADANEVMAAAVAGGFGAAAHQRVVRKAKTRRAYYHKLHAALKAGYLIVPNLPLTMVAVRTDQEAPTPQSSDRKWVVFEQAGRSLLPGTGRYVSSAPITSTYVMKRENGKEERKYFPEAFNEVIDFPLDVARPEVIQATSKALAMRLFDQIGVCRNQAASGDPIICGVIRDSSRAGKAVTFFIAWALNPETL